MQAMNQRYPGRLRLRFPQLRRQPIRAAEAAAAVRRLQGVVSADANVVTGGLLIVYDVAMADACGLWPALRATLAGHGLSEERQGVAPQARGTGSALAAQAADKLVGTLVEKLVERSALALVAAIL